MEFYSPASLQDALIQLEEGRASIVAGGTDFFPGLQRGKAPRDLLDVSRLTELKGISRTDDGWRIGGATTWSEIIRHDLPPAFDGLKAAAREVGSVQIQNSGTIAGNICNASPAADSVPPLLVLGAQVEIASAQGTRLLSLEDFICGVRRVDLCSGELVKAVHIPVGSARGFGSFLKLGSRKYLVISIAMVAAAVELDADGLISRARVAVGACSPVACRIPALEEAVTGLDLDTLKAGFEGGPEYFRMLSPIDDVRASAEYRMKTASELCRRSLILAVEKGMNSNA